MGSQRGLQCLVHLAMSQAQGAAISTLQMNALVRMKIRRISKKKEAEEICFVENNKIAHIHFIVKSSVSSLPSAKDWEHQVTSLI